MPHRCIAGGCSNIRKDDSEISHGGLKDEKYLETQCCSYNLKNHGAPQTEKLKRHDKNISHGPSNTRRSRHEEVIGNEKLLEYI